MRRAAKIFRTVITLSIVIGIIAIGIGIYTTCSGTPLIQTIDKSEPEISAVPIEVATITRNYLARQAWKNDDESVTMNDWYQREDGEWVLHPGKITIPAIFKPRILQRQ